MAIFLPQRWQQQPQMAVDIDPAWASQGVILAHRPLIDGPLVTITGTVTSIARPQGRGVSISGVGSRVIISDLKNVLFDMSKDATVLWVGRTVTTTGSYPTIFRRGNSGGATAQRAGFAMVPTTANAYFFYRNAADTAWQQTSDFSATSTAVWVGRKSGSNLTIWRNGVLLDTVSGVSDGAVPTSSSEVAFGATSSGQDAGSAEHLLGMFANKAISNAAIAELGKNPWQLFRPLRPIIYSFPSSITIPTLTNATVTDIGTTTARPRVTVTF